MRRCQEDLAPSPAHPGCIYGEMAMCLRPCQQVVGAAEYATEIVRVAEFLDLFQMRRCQEDLAPSPAHPGCIYGEMAMCLRPCQQVVGAAEYATEIGRVAEFLRTDGRSLLESIGHSRDRLSQEMLF